MEKTERFSKVEDAVSSTPRECHIPENRWENILDVDTSGVTKTRMFEYLVRI
jgi:hypothetical protein